MPVEHVQTKHEIEGLLATAGIHPRKRFGQHFLIDGNLMRRLVDRAELRPDDLVLEVGSGTGGLTDLLVDRVGQLIGVEIDRNLHAILTDRFREAADVRLIHGDILESKHRLHREVAEAIRGFAGGSTRRVVLVANLPYQVATPLVMNLLVDYPEVRRLCFTVQAEVGDRLTARPGGKDYGPLSIISQILGTLETVARIPPPAFWPRPAVDSVMIRMDVQDNPPGAPDEVREFATLVRTVFDHRRKTLRSALGYAVDPAARDRVCQAFDGTRRPESFSVGEWLEISRLI